MLAWNRWAAAGTVMLLMAGCTSEPDADDLAGFVPPTVTLRSELPPLLERRFARLDKNFDRKITADELAPNRAARLSERDTDKNGSLSQDEFTATALARFDRMDADHDGTLTSAERVAAKDAR